MKLQHLLTAAAFLTGPGIVACASADVAGTAYITALSSLPAEDVVAIEQVILRMNHAVDAEDYALYAEFYTEDGWISSGFGEPVTGRRGIIASLEGSRAFITNKRHTAVNPVIWGEGDTATARYYLLVLERAASLSFAGSAMITDTFRRTPDGWKATSHTTQMDPATLAAMAASQ